MCAYKTAPDLVLRTIAGENLLLAIGSRIMANQRMLELSDTGAYLWNLMAESPVTCETMAEKLAEEFDVAYNIALEDTQVFCDNLAGCQYLETVG